MKRQLSLVSFLTVLTLILAACGGNTEIAGDSATQEPGDQLLATEAPVVPIDLAGPLMQVGSFYSYVDGAILAAVPGGPFVMGYNFFDNLEREVSVGDFWIYTGEVTNDQYAYCVELGKYTPPDKEDNPGYGNYRFGSFPVVGVTHQQAVDYCTTFNGRLPTETEWEKTARGPLEAANLFPWGDNLPDCSLLNFNYCTGKPVQVKSYEAGVSYYGVWDLAGNVREWVADWYEPEYNADGLIVDPLGPELGQRRSVRSSSFADSTDFALAAHRFSLKPEDHLPDLGFRCVVVDPTYFAPYCEVMSLYGSDGKGNPGVTQIDYPDCIQPQLEAVGDCENQETRIEIIPWPLPEGAELVEDLEEGECEEGAPRYQCSGSGSITVNPQPCDLPPPPDGGDCPPGYNRLTDSIQTAAAICSGSGLGNQCLPGYTYDPQLHCCSSSSGGPGGLCPPGYYQKGNTCYPTDSNPPVLESDYVEFNPINRCRFPSGGEGGSSTGACQPANCQYPSYPDPNDPCSCISP